MMWETRDAVRGLGRGNARKLLYERGIRYSSSMRGDDRPYRTVIDGRETDFIEIPTSGKWMTMLPGLPHVSGGSPAGQDRISSCYQEMEDNFMREFEGH